MIAIVLTMLKMLPVGDKVPPQALAIVPTAGTKLPQRMRARLAETATQGQTERGCRGKAPRMGTPLENSKESGRLTAA